MKRMCSDADETRHDDDANAKINNKNAVWDSESELEGLRIRTFASVLGEMSAIDCIGLDWSAECRQLRPKRYLRDWEYANEATQRNATHWFSARLLVRVLIDSTFHFISVYPKIIYSTIWVLQTRK